MQEIEQIQNELRESEERFKALADGAPVFIWIQEENAGCLFANANCVKFYGGKLENVMGSKWQAALHPDDKEPYLKSFRSAFKNTSPFKTQARLLRSDGCWRWHEMSATPKMIAGKLVYVGISQDISLRKEAEAIADRYKLLSEKTDDIIWFTDDQGNFVDVNRAMIAKYGYSRDQVLNMNIADIRDPSTLPDLPKQLEEAKKGSTHFETVHRKRNGEPFPVEVSATVSEFGGECLIMAIVRDIKERRDAEVALLISNEKARASELQLKIITDSLPVLISYIDRNEQYRFVNKKYSEWFHMETSEFLSKKVREVVGEAAYKSVKPYLVDVLNGNERAFDSWITYEKAGHKFVQTSMVPDISEDGRVRGIYALTKDLTELKLSQEKLRSSEERLALFVETVADYAILSTDENGIIDSWNKGAEIIFGYKDDEVIGKSGEILFSTEDLTQGMAEREMRTARKKGRANTDRWYVRKDGTRFFANGVMIPLFSGDTVNGFVKIATDLTEKQRRVDELQQAHDELEIRVSDRTKELGELNQALFQEIEERKQSESQRVDLLRRLVNTQEHERSRIARDIHDQLGQRLTALRLKIAALVDISEGNIEISSRAQRLQEIAATLDSEVSFVAWELRPSALDDLGLIDAVGTFVNEWSRHYEIPADFHATYLGPKRLDREIETQLYRIAQEGLNNIAKHARPDQVSVLIEKRGEDVILIIEDNGVGFEVSKTVGNNHNGKGGLGLLGMKERASLIGGDVEIESTPKVGTTIFIRIPFSLS